MSATLDFYLSQAAECAQAARETTLENVRERSLRAEAAWTAMANRLSYSEKKRSLDAQEKAEGASGAAGVPWPVSRPPRQVIRKG